MMSITKSLFTLLPAVLLLFSACVVGDGDFNGPDPDPGCRAFPDAPERCGQPWEGRLVETCSDSAVTTSLRFDRPDVPDSLRANAMVLGEERIFDMHWGAPIGAVIPVCDGSLCREFLVEFRSHSALPVFEGAGSLTFWEYDAVHDAMTGTADTANATADMLIDAADGGTIRLDAARLCP